MSQTCTTCTTWEAKWNFGLMPECTVHRSWTANSPMVECPLQVSLGVVVLTKLIRPLIDHADDQDAASSRQCMEICWVTNRPGAPEPYWRELMLEVESNHMAKKQHSVACWSHAYIRYAFMIKLTFLVFEPQMWCLTVPLVSVYFWMSMVY